MTIPDSVTTVAGFSFWGCKNLVSANLPQGLVHICDYAFRDCSSLSSVTIPDGVVSLGTSAFDGCESLTFVVVPPSVISLGNRTFADCKHLVVATILSQYVTVLQELATGVPECQAFRDCHRLQYVVAPPHFVHDPGEHFVGTPVLSVGGLVGDTPSTRRRAVSLQYWSFATHHLCSQRRRKWVQVVMLVAMRLSRRGLHLVPEMWITVLGCIRRDLLGPG